MSYSDGLKCRARSTYSAAKPGYSAWLLPSDERYQLLPFRSVRTAAFNENAESVTKRESEARQLAALKRAAEGARDLG